MTARTMYKTSHKSYEEFLVRRFEDTKHAYLDRLQTALRRGPLKVSNYTNHIGLGKSLRLRTARGRGTIWEWYPTHSPFFFSSVTAHLQMLLQTSTGFDKAFVCTSTVVLIKHSCSPRTPLQRKVAGGVQLADPLAELHINIHELCDKMSEHQSCRRAEH